MVAGKLPEVVCIDIGLVPGFDYKVGRVVDWLGFYQVVRAGSPGCQVSWCWFSFPSFILKIIPLRCSRPVPEKISFRNL